MVRTSDEEEKASVLDGEVDDFLHYLSSSGVASDQTIRAYRSDLEHFASFLEEQNLSSMKEIDTEVIHRYFSKLKEGDYKNSTVVRKLASLRSFFDRMVSNEGGLKQNPTSKMDYPKLTDRLPTYLSEEEMENLLNAPDCTTLTGRRNRVILELIYSTGIRAGELQQLNIEDVDRVGRTVRIQGKGNKERVVPIGGEAIDVVQSYLRVWKEEGRIQSGTSGALIRNRFGKRLSTRSIRRAVSREAEKAGLTEEVSPHTLRHTFATHMLQNGADLRTLQEILGHENLHTTEIYTHITDEQLKDAYDRSNPVS